MDDPSFLKHFSRWILLYSLSITPRTGAELAWIFRQPSFFVHGGESIFPTLETQLEEGNIAFDAAGSEKAYTLTSRGHEALQAEPNGLQYREMFHKLLATMSAVRELEESQLRLQMALKHLSDHGNDVQRVAASAIALRACHELFQILAP